MKLDLILGRTGQTTSATLDLSSRENGSLLITGISGGGKSTLLRRLVRQVPGQGGHVIVFELARDFEAPPPAGSAALAPAGSFYRIDVRRDLWMNPLAPRILPSGLPESASDIGSRFAADVARAYRLKVSQEVALANATTEFCCSSAQPYSVGGLILYCQADNRLAASVKTSVGRLVHLANTINCTVAQPSFVFDRPGISTLVFSDIPSDSMQALVAEFVLGSILNDRMRGVSGKEIPLVFVFDECHRLRLDRNSSLMKLLREGRRFNTAAWCSTQSVTDREAADALGNAATHLYFRQVGSQVVNAANDLACGDQRRKEQLIQELPRLQRGEFLLRSKENKVVQITSDREM